MRLNVDGLVWEARDAAQHVWRCLTPPEGVDAGLTLQSESGTWLFTYDVVGMARFKSEVDPALVDSVERPPMERVLAWAAREIHRATGPLPEETPAPPALRVLSMQVSEDGRNGTCVLQVGPILLKGHVRAMNQQGWERVYLSYPKQGDEFEGADRVLVEDFGVWQEMQAAAVAEFKRLRERRRADA